MEVNTPAGPQHQESSHWFASYLNGHTDWLEKTKGNLVVAATVIGAMSFQAMIDPPGGVSQIGDEQSPKVIHNDTFFADLCNRSGTSVIGCGPNAPPAYIWMVISSNVAFAASMGVILLAVSGLRLRNRFMIMIMQVFMMTAILCISASFFLAVVLVHPKAIDLPIFLTQMVYLAFWVFFAIVMLIIQLFRLICPHRCRSTPQLGPSHT